MRTQRKFLAILMALCLMISMMPMAAFADGADNGEAADTVQWSYENGTLTVSGSGSIADYKATVSQGVFQSSTVPWSEYANQITKVVVESGIDKIGQYAFAGFPNLKEVTIADSVKEISWRAFGWCESLETFTIPDGVTTLKNEIIRNTAVTEITIPASVTEITYAALKYVDLDNIYVAEGNSTFISEDGVLYADSGATLKCVPCGRSSFTIPETVNGKTVTQIGQWAFGACDKITEITIPENITTIGEAAFYECSGISTLTIPSTITSVAGSTFQYMTNLEDVYWNSTAGLKTANAWTDAGKNTAGGFTVHFGNNLSKIPDWLMGKATYLTKVVILNENSIEIGLRSFWGCTGLTNDSIDFSTVSKVGTYSFANCTGLTELNLPESVKEIGEGGFHSCGNISVVTLPVAMTKISQDAFKNCTSLTTLNYNPTNASCPGGSENYAFSQINSQELAVNIGSNVTNIPQRSFSGNTSLKTITIPDNVTNIGAFAFNNCKNLETVIIGNGITGMGQDAFTGLPEGNWICLTDGEKAASIISILTRTNNPVYTTSSGKILVMNGGEVVTSEAGEKSITNGNYSVEWYESADLTGTSVEPVNGKTYYAKWVSTITLDPNGGTLGENVASSVTVEEGKSFSAANIALPTPTKDGYDFGGWYTEDGTKVEEGTTPNGNATYTARWVKKVGDDTYYVVPTIDDVEYTGQALTPNVEVTKNNETVYSGYTVTYQNNINAGTATAIVTLDDNDKTEIGRVTFTITKATPNISITANPASPSGGGVVTLTVNGMPAEGTVTVTCTSDNNVSVTGSGSTFTTSSLPNETKAYTFKAAYTGAENGNYNNTEATIQVQVTRHTSGGGGGSSSSSTSTVSVDTAKNGTVTVSPKNASKGTTVTITAKPDKGYEVDEVVVTDKNGKEIAVKDKGDNKFTFTMPSGKVDVEVTFVKEYVTPAISFDDVSKNAWYYDAAIYAAENGLMSGTGNGNFSPDMTTSRAMIWTTLARLDGQNVAVTSGNWYDKAQSWAVSRGVSDGTRPDAPITREQLAVMLYGFAKDQGYTTKNGVSLNRYTDASAVSPWAAEALEWAVGNGLISSMGNNILAPTGTATRAQVAVILMNFCENIAK